MSCLQAKKFMDAYIDGELETAAMLEVETHLDECPVCRALFRLKSDIKREIRNLGKGIQAPDHLRRRIEASAAAPRRHAGKWLAMTIIPAAAAAAAAVLILVTGPSGSNSEEVSAVVEDVIQRHSRELPMEVNGSDPREAASWFRGKVDFPVEAPGFAVKNASFQGARVSNVQTQQAAHMVYNVDGHRVTVMIFPADTISVQEGNVYTKNGRSILTGTRRGYNVAMLKERGMVYALSSDLPVEKLVSLLAEGTM